MEETVNRLDYLFSREYLTDIASNLIESAVTILITFIALFLVKIILGKAIDLYFAKNKKKYTKTNRTLQALLHNVLQYSYYFLLIYSILGILGVPVSTLVAGAGVASLAIGLGAQGFVSDCVNGFFILLEHQYKVGDYVHIGNTQGVVKSLGLRITVLEDWNHQVYYIPHRSIVEVMNESVYPIRYDIDFNVFPDTNFKQFEDAVKLATETADEKIANMLTESPIYYGADRDNRGRLIYRLRLHCNIDDGADVIGYYYAHVSQVLTEQGIEMPLAYGGRSRNEVTFEDIISEKEKISASFEGEA